MQHTGEKKSFFSDPAQNVPNLLTLFRLICSPLFLPILIVYGLPYNNVYINGFVAVLFALFSLTDFFDGYLARALKQETFLGKLLDPIADKFLLYATLVSLLAAKKIFFYWVLVLVGREFFMMGLRQIAAEHNFSVKVSLLGKLKTALQMCTLLLIIFNPYQELGFLGAFSWNGLELFLLSATTGVSLLSAQRYYCAFVPLMEQRASDERARSLAVD